MTVLVSWKEKIFWQTSSQPHCFKLFLPDYQPQYLLRGESLVSSSPLLLPPSLRFLISLSFSGLSYHPSLLPLDHSLIFFWFNKPYFPNV